MKKRIIRNTSKEDIITVDSLSSDKFVIFQRGGSNRSIFGMLLPDSFYSKSYRAIALDNSLAEGNGWVRDTTTNDGTVEGWMKQFDNSTFYQVDTLKEVFELTL